jgi:hypothetical protein
MVPKSDNKIDAYSSGVRSESLTNLICSSFFISQYPLSYTQCISYIIDSKITLLPLTNKKMPPDF